MKNYLVFDHSSKTIPLTNGLWWILLLFSFYLSSRLLRRFSCLLYHAYGTLHLLLKYMLICYYSSSYLLLFLVLHFIVITYTTHHPFPLVGQESRVDNLEQSFFCPINIPFIWFFCVFKNVFFVLFFFFPFIFFVYFFLFMVCYARLVINFLEKKILGTKYLTKFYILY